MDILHLGLGSRGRHWLDIVRNRPDMASRGCVDPDTGAQAWAQTAFPQVPWYASLGEALRQVKADAVLIASLPAWHAAHALEALAAGLAVMIEPPLAAKLTEGAQIMDMARRTGQPVVVAHHHRYRRCEQALRTLVRQGTVGTITPVSCIDRRALQAPEPFLTQVDYAQLFDGAAHHFDSLRHIFDVEPIGMMTQCGQAPGSAYTHGSTTEAFVEMEQQVSVQYYGSLTGHRDEHELRIEGEYGALRSDMRRVWWRKRGSRFFLPLRLPTVPPGDARVGPRAGTVPLLDQLHAAVQAGVAPPAQGAEPLWTLAMLEAAMLSDKTGQAVCLADVLAAAGLGSMAASRNRQDAQV